MDWLEERVVRLQRYIRDLSFRKAMIAYILVLSVVVFGLSYLTIIVCWQWEMEEWVRYERADLADLVYRKGPLWGFRRRNGLLEDIIFGFDQGMVSVFLCICRDDIDSLHLLQEKAGKAFVHP